MIDGLPDAAGAVGGAKRLLKLGDWLSRLAFPIAASLSAVSFAAAHFASWGFSPFVLALNVILGLFLAHTAYKSRSLTSPVVAHLVFNLVTIGGFFIAMAYSPFTGAAFAVIAGLLGAASLLHGWLSARKERAFRLKNGGKAFAAVMLAVMSLSLFNAGTTNPITEASSRLSSAITVVQEKAAAAPQVPTVELAPAAPQLEDQAREHDASGHRDAHAPARSREEGTEVEEVPGGAGVGHVRRREHGVGGHVEGGP
jgi:hypothetical protein